MSGETPHVAIIGGGMTGVAAAFFLQETAREQGRPLAVTVIEASGRLGGKVLTDRVDGFFIEAGPDSFLARKPWARQLAERVGLGDDLVPTDPRHRHTFVLGRGRLHPIPEGLFMFVPVRLGAFARTRLISPWGKARMALEPLVPKGPEGDETIAAFVTRRAGREALERLAEPLLTGIYSGRADRLSILSTFPQLKEMEQRAGSLWKGFMSGPRAQAGGGSAFLSLRGGLDSLVQAVARRLDAVTVRTGVKVTRLALADAAAAPGEPKAPAGAGRDRYRLALSDGTYVAADAVIVATPAFAAADLIEPICPEAAPHLRAIRFVSTITCVLGYNRADLQHPLNGSGFLVPRKEGRPITACTWVSSKWAHAARPDQALIRCYLGRDGEQEVMGWSDDKVVAAVRNELRELMGITAAPQLVRVYRWERAMPQYEVGHRERVAAIERAVAKRPGIVLAGASYHGVGVPDCVRQGQQAAERVLLLISEKDGMTPA